jgi:hypothetical protein
MIGPSLSKGLAISSRSESARRSIFTSLVVTVAGSIWLMGWRCVNLFDGISDEITKHGLVTSDSFAGLRGLLVPSNQRRPVSGAKGRGRILRFDIESGGRWALIRRASPADDQARAAAPGGRLAALTDDRLIYRDGIPVATLSAGKVQFLIDMDTKTQWEAEKRLVRSAARGLLSHLS